MKNYTTEELRRFSSDELNVMVDENEISWSEWVEAQPDTYDGYHEWLEQQRLERNDESARRFIREVEESMMDEAMSIETQQCIDLEQKFRQMTK